MKRIKVVGFVIVALAMATVVSLLAVASLWQGTIAADEYRVASSLEMIWRAQRRYHAFNGSYAANFEMLRAYGLDPLVFSQDRERDYELTIGSSDVLLVSATPMSWKCALVECRKLTVDSEGYCWASTSDTSDGRVTLLKRFYFDVDEVGKAEQS